VSPPPPPAPARANPGPTAAQLAAKRAAAKKAAARKAAAMKAAAKRKAAAAAAARARRADRPVKAFVPTSLATADEPSNGSGLEQISVVMLLFAALLIVGAAAPARAVAAVPGVGRTMLQWRIGLAALGISIVCAVGLTLLAGSGF
jgi:hypothetical protein